MPGVILKPVNAGAVTWPLETSYLLFPSLKSDVFSTIIFLLPGQRRSMLLTRRLLEDEPLPRNNKKGVLDIKDSIQNIKAELLYSTTNRQSLNVIESAQSSLEAVLR